MFLSQHITQPRFHDSFPPDRFPPRQIPTPIDLNGSFNCRRFPDTSCLQTGRCLTRRIPTPNYKTRRYPTPNYIKRQCLTPIKGWYSKMFWVDSNVRLLGVFGEIFYTDQIMRSVTDLKQSTFRHEVSLGICQFIVDGHTNICWNDRQPGIPSRP